LDHQQRFIDSAKKQGGFGRKITHMQLRGVPDLLIGMPQFSLALFECKDFGATAPQFARKIPATKHQRATLDRYNAAVRRTVGGILIRTLHLGVDRMSLVHADKLIFSSALLEKAPSVVWDEDTKQYVGIAAMLRKFGIPEVK
jgi:hypothetical protein